MYGIRQEVVEFVRLVRQGYVLRLTVFQINADRIRAGTRMGVMALTPAPLVKLVIQQGNAFARRLPVQLPLDPAVFPRVLIIVAMHVTQPRPAHAVVLLRVHVLARL